MRKQLWGCLEKKEVEPKAAKSNYFEGHRLADKVAIKLIDVAIITGGLKKSDNVKAILAAAAFPTTDSYLICADSAVVYVEKGKLTFKSNRYPLSSISGISLESPSFAKTFVVFTVGGGGRVVCEIIATKPDVQAFFDFVQSKLQAEKAAPVSASSVADELLKYKQLFDAGVLTQEEFDAQKKKLLG